MRSFVLREQLLRIYVQVLRGVSCARTECEGFFDAKRTHDTRGDTRSTRVTSVFFTRPQGRVDNSPGKVDTPFWFQQRRHVDIRAASRWLRQLAPHTEMAEASVHLLRSGLFYHRHIKKSADILRRQIGGAYGGVHVRRSDKIICSTMTDCEVRDRHTRRVDRRRQ